MSQMALLQKGKTTTDYTNYTDFSLEEIRVICEIRGKASSCSRVICGKIHVATFLRQQPIPRHDRCAANMINVCSKCGAYRADKVVDSSRSVAVCPECAHIHPFRFTPLFLVGGASGAGKSALVEPLIRRQPPVVVLETDILWRPEFNKPDEHYRDYFETWLRLAKNIAQNGRPVLLLGAGFAVPGNIEPVRGIPLFRADTHIGPDLPRRSACPAAASAPRMAGQPFTIVHRRQSDLQSVVPRPSRPDGGLPRIGHIGHRRRQNGGAGSGLGVGTECYRRSTMIR